MKRARQSLPGAAALTAYTRSYKGGGASDFHFAVFQAAAELLPDCKSVLYAGSHRHLTMSLAFPDVLYIDIDERVGDVFASESAAEFVSENKTYEEEHAMVFRCADYTELQPDRKFDLLASLSAGQAAPHCSKHVRKGGFILASDAHSDARTALLMDCWQLFAVWDDEKETFTTEKETLDRCFRVRGTGNKLISAEQVRESVEVGAVSKRKFKLVIEPMFFLFRKKD